MALPTVLNVRSGTRNSLFDYFEYRSILSDRRSLTALHLSVKPVRSAHRIEHRCYVCYRGSRIEDYDPGRRFASDTRWHDERRAGGEQSGRPGVVVFRGPPLTTEHQHGKLGLDEQLEVGPGTDILGRLTCHGQRRLDRLGVRIGPMDGEREPERKSAGAPAQMHRVIGWIPLVPRVEGIQVGC